MVLVQCGLAQSGSTYHRPNAVCHAMSLCAACAGTADLRQPPCALWCRLRAAGECAYPQTVSWPPLPFSPTNTNHFFIKTLQSAWAYCPARYSVHSFLSFYLVLHLVLLPAPVQAVQGLPQLLSHSPPYILEANATASQRCMTVSRGYSPPFLFFRCYPPSFPPPAPSFPTTPLP